MIMLFQSSGKRPRAGERDHLETFLHEQLFERSV
jgi:hypothetical protein